MKTLFKTLCLFLLSFSLQSQTTVNLSAEKDNTMYSENGNNSNGIGSYIFAGRTQGGAGTDIRRALIKFDLSTIPAGSLITAVSLEVTGSNGGPNLVSLHLLNNDWGEAGSNAPGAEGQGTAAQNGDATWTMNFFNLSSWTAAGGDFVASASSGASVQSGNVTAFTSVAMVDDVQDWIDGTLANYGWVLIGDETAPGTAVRMNSRENVAGTPVLKVTYDAPTPRVLINELNTQDQWVEIYNPNAVNVDITDWFLCNRPAYGKIGTGAVTLLSGALDMPAGSYTVLEWGGIGSGVAEMGLYRTNAYNNPTAMEDYLQYNGILSPSRASTAVSAGVWSGTGDFVPPLTDPSQQTFSLKQGAYVDGTDTGLSDWWEQVPTPNEINPFCPYTVFETGILPTDVYEASFRLGSDGTILSGDNVTFLAGNTIELIGPFTVQTGGIFLADINLCQ